MKFPLILRAAESKPIEARRSCGPCTACCVLPRILPDSTSGHLEQGKPGYTPCSYLLPDRVHDVSGCGRCTIYEDRPIVCREYACLWRMGMVVGDERRRPDQLGLMFTVDTFLGTPVVECWELWRGAARDHPGRGVLDSLAERTRVVVRWYGVPCSVIYKNPESQFIGEQLSRWAQEEPDRLANWLERQITNRRMEDPSNGTVVQELEALRRGETVKPHFQPPSSKAAKTGGSAR